MNRHQRLLFLFILGGASLSAPRTHAANVADGTPAQTRWYGTPTLVIDVAAITVFTAAVTLADRNRRDTFGVPAALAFLAGGPLVHAGHGNWGRNLASLSMRVAFPAVGTFPSAAPGGPAESRRSFDCFSA
jgi:hypothetical protein